MSWPVALFTAGISLTVFGLLKYGFNYLVAQIERKAIMEAMKATLKEDMHEEILDRIDYVTAQTLTGVLYSNKAVKVTDKEGNLVGFIRRAEEIKATGTSDN